MNSRTRATVGSGALLGALLTSGVWTHGTTGGMGAAAGAVLDFPADSATVLGPPLRPGRRADLAVTVTNLRRATLRLLHVAPGGPVVAATAHPACARTRLTVRTVPVALVLRHRQRATLTLPGGVRAGYRSAAGCPAAALRPPMRVFAETLG